MTFFGQFTMTVFVLLYKNIDILGGRSDSQVFSILLRGDGIR